MAPPKKVTTYVKLQIEAGKATPAPPVGPALGQAQVNIMEFCKQFNARTQNKDMAGLIIPVVITVYADRSFRVCDQDAARRGAPEEGSGPRQGLGHAQQGEGGQGDGETGARDCHAEDAGFERGVSRDGDQEHQGNRAVDGN